MAYAKHFSTRKTPQHERIPGSNQIKNNEGGYTYPVDKWVMLDRFLILGSEGGTYYTTERKLTVESAENVLACLKEDGPKAVNRIVEISTAGRAPKNDPALFALSLAVSFGDELTRCAAYNSLSEVARTATHLFQFLNEVQENHGWGSGLRRAVQNWYLHKDPNQVAYQATKYRQRHGWTHRDVLRKAHPKAVNPAMQAIFQWIVKGQLPEGFRPEIITGFQELQESESVEQTCKILDRNPNLSWEMVKPEHLSDRKVWYSLLPNLPMTALIRNLGRMTSLGVLKPLSESAKFVYDRITDKGMLERARIHPVSLVTAMATYQQGHGVKGNLTWEPVQKVNDALEEGFYLSFDNVEPTGRKTLLALDVSGSMTAPCGGAPMLSCRAGAAAMAMVTARTEENYHFMAFSHRFVKLPITAKTSLRDALAKTDRLTFGGTDCSLPMLWAMKNEVDVDVFVVYTDHETWYGSIHPMQALRQYRQESGLGAKLVVVGMAGNKFTIADPQDAGSLDCVGFDTSTPSVIADFSRN